MPSPKGGAAIVFGKIQILGGQGESLDECRQELFKILKTAGYPEQEKDDDYDDYDDDDEFDERAARAEEDAALKESVPWKNIIKKEE